MPIRDTLLIDMTKGWSTHMPVLIKLFNKTKGPIMEIGGGVYSTPLLHWLCSDTKRKLVTYENDKNFIQFAKQYVARYHSIRLVDNFLSIPNTDRYSIIFIDHNGHERGKTAVHFKNSADYVVIHDSNVIEKNMYQIAFPQFKYRKDYDRCKPWTTVLSNFKKLDNLW